MSFMDSVKNAKKKGCKPGKGKPSKGGGFKAAVKNVRNGGKFDEDEAAAIVANASRKASPAAKRKNPTLKKVK